MSHTHDHFGGKDALGHLLDARSKGLAAGSEPHGIEASGIWHAACDSVRTTAVASLFILFVEQTHPLGLPHKWRIAGLAAAWALWMGGRSAFLGWARLERLVHVIAEEKREIDTNRDMEKQELKEIYALKGFQGQLLDDVVNTLAADNNRLLQVMLEEELGVTQFCQDHPLLQGFGAAASSFLVGTASVIGYYEYGVPGLIIPILFFLISAFVSAKLSRTAVIKSIVWQTAIATLTITSLYYALMFL